MKFISVKNQAGKEILINVNNISFIHQTKDDKTVIGLFNDYENVIKTNIPISQFKRWFNKVDDFNFFNLPFKDKVELELTKIKSILLSKNEKYGNSALEPVRIFSKANQTDQLLSRIDDKLSRIKNMGTDTQIDEDTVNDLIGYLILLKISKL
jgi:hypothetical protein